MPHEWRVLGSARASKQSSCCVCLRDNVAGAFVFLSWHSVALSVCALSLDSRPEAPLLPLSRVAAWHASSSLHGGDEWSSAARSGGSVSRADVPVAVVVGPPKLGSKRLESIILVPARSISRPGDRRGAPTGVVDVVAAAAACRWAHCNAVEATVNPEMPSKPAVPAMPWFVDGSTPGHGGRTIAPGEGSGGAGPHG